MSLFHRLKHFLKSLTKYRPDENETDEESMKAEMNTEQSTNPGVIESISTDLPVYLQYVTKTERVDSNTYCMSVRTTQFGCYTTYRSVVKDFPIPDPHDKSGCELFIGFPLLELYPGKEKNENKFGLLTIEEKKFVQDKIDEAFLIMKDKGRELHYIIFDTELQADWCISRTPNSKRTTDVCVEVTCKSNESKKETYKIDGKSSDNFPEKKHNNTSGSGYGYANIYRSQNTRYDGKKWDFDKKEWVDNTTKSNHPTPVMLEGEKLVEIPEA